MSVADVRSQGPSAQFWTDALAAWAIPDYIVEAAPANPWQPSPEVFTKAAQAALAGEREPFVRRVLEALPEGGSVLDVGAGAGAASLPLFPPASSVVAVDQSPAMLEAFARAASAAGLAAGIAGGAGGSSRAGDEGGESSRAGNEGGGEPFFEIVEGPWPDAESRVPIADVVVCANVAYNVVALVPFLVALDRHARHRVALELTWQHPLSELSECWRSIHGLSRPERPTAEDALAVAREAGLPAALERWEASARPAQERAERVLLACRQLCVSTTRSDEVDRCLPDPFPPRQKATIWWDTWR